MGEKDKAKDWSKPPEVRIVPPPSPFARLRKPWSPLLEPACYFLLFFCAMTAVFLGEILGNSLRHHPFRPDWEFLIIYTVIQTGLTSLAGNAIVFPSLYPVSDPLTERLNSFSPKADKRPITVHLDPYDFGE